jgi:CBS domain-containing protein
MTSGRVLRTVAGTAMRAKLKKKRTTGTTRTNASGKAKAGAKAKAKANAGAKASAGAKAKAKANANATAGAKAKAKARAGAGAKTSAARVRDMMNSPVMCLTAGHTASDAWAIMRAEEVRHAVVLRGSTVIGVISERDLGGVNGGAVRRGKTVADLMTEEPIVVNADLPVTTAIALVSERHVGCLPVLDGKKLVGVVTRTDLLRFLSPTKSRRPARKPGAADLPRPPRMTSPTLDRRH